MTTHVTAAPRRSALAIPPGLLTPPVLLTAALFAFLYAKPMQLLARDWWNNPEAGHGLLLAPLAIYFAWKTGIGPDARPNRALGLAFLLGGVGFRYLADLAAELFTMRGSMLMAAAGITIWYFGFRQVLRWWLPFTLLALSIPLPDIVLSRIALPLQFTASKIGASLLAWRDIPVLLQGNVIRIPGHQLFVAEACSGLRSLTALLSLGVLLGAVTLSHPLSRAMLLACAIPVAIVLNGVRVFLTGFLVFFVDPKLGEGFMHLTEGWLIFIVAFTILGGLAWAFLALERRIKNGPKPRREEVEEYEEEYEESAEEYAAESEEEVGDPAYASVVAEDGTTEPDGTSRRPSLAGVPTLDPRSKSAETVDA